MQQAGTQKWLRCVLLPLRRGERSAPAWSQNGGRGENHKVKIEAAGARTRPVQDQRWAGPQHTTKCDDDRWRSGRRGLELWSVYCVCRRTLRSVKRTEGYYHWTNEDDHATKLEK